MRSHCHLLVTKISQNTVPPELWWEITGSQEVALVEARVVEILKPSNQIHKQITNLLLI
jgi:hypothetical protein